MLKIEPRTAPQAHSHELDVQVLDVGNRESSADVPSHRLQDEIMSQVAAKAACDLSGRNAVSQYKWVSGNTV